MRHSSLLVHFNKYSFKRVNRISSFKKIFRISRRYLLNKIKLPCYINDLAHLVSYYNNSKASFLSSRSLLAYLFFILRFYVLIAL